MTPARMAQDYCGPTCPEVDKEFDNMWEALESMIPSSLHRDARSALNDCCNGVKSVGTERLREALECACGELIEAQANVADLEKRVEQLQHEVDTMESA